MLTSCLSASSSLRPRFHAVTCYLCSSVRAFASATPRLAAPPAASWQVEKFRRAAEEIRREREEAGKLKKLQEVAERLATGQAAGHAAGGGKGERGGRHAVESAGSRGGVSSKDSSAELPGVPINLSIPSPSSSSRKLSRRPPRPPPPPKAPRSREPYDFHSSSPSWKHFPKPNHRRSSSVDIPPPDTYLSLSTPRSPPSSSSSTHPEAPSGTHAWQPTKKLTYSAMAGIRTLYSLDPEQYTKAALSEKFGVSYEAISRIVKSKFREKHAGAHEKLLAELGLEDVAGGGGGKAKVKQDVRGRVRGKWRGEGEVGRGDKRLQGTKWDIDPRTSETSSPVPALLRAFGKGQLK